MNMKNLNFCLLFCLCLISSGINSMVWAGNAGASRYGNSFDVGVQTIYLDYEEDNAKVKEKGVMFGIAGRYVFQGRDGFYFSSAMEINYGGLDYDGQTWAGTPVSGDTDDWIINCRGVTGFAVYENQALSVTPFTGLAYRYWYDDIKASGGYQREIQYLYVPVGVEVVGMLPHGWRVAISTEYDLFLCGRVKSYLSDADPGYNDPENDQDFASGYGLRVSAVFKKRISRDRAISIEPFVRYWNIDKSDYATLTYYAAYAGKVYEPENTSTIYGLKVGIGF